MTSSPLIIDRILLDATTTKIENDESVWLAASDFFRWAMTVACLIPGEFPENLYNLDKLDFYAGQVHNGGHSQFAYNSELDPDVTYRITIGFSEISTPAFAAIYEDFLRLIDSDSDLRSVVLTLSYGKPPKEIADLDSRFSKLGNYFTIQKHLADWVRSSPNLTLLPSEELHREKEAIMARNTALTARRAAKQRAREAAEAANPVYVAARQLCALSGLTFSSLTAGYHDGQPDTVSWGVMTSNGVFYMLFGPKQAQLSEPKTGKILGTVPVAV